MTNAADALMAIFGLRRAPDSRIVSVTNVNGCVIVEYTGAPPFDALMADAVAEYERVNGAMATCGPVGVDGCGSPVEEG